MDWFQFMKEAGATAAVLELAAIWWLLGDRKEMKEEIKGWRASLADAIEKRDNLAERLWTVTAEMKSFLFSSERKP